MKPPIGIIGVGKVGASLARLLYAADYPIVAVYNRTPEKAEHLARITSAKVAKTPTEVINMAEIILLTVADDAISQVVEQSQSSDWPGKIAVHTSGAASLDVLQPLAEVGALVGSLHPAFPFSDVGNAIQNLAGATFAIEAENTFVQQKLSTLVAALQGQTIIIPAGKKALYHAALVFASNYTVTLYAIAESLLLALGANQASADNALNTLLAATVKNIEQQGIPQALTGPLVRADVGTIQAHLSAINNDELHTLYSQLARQSYPMLQARGVNITLIEEVLQEIP